MPKEPLTEKEIKKIIQMEIKNCFEELATDVKDIKQALLGNDYQKGGLVAIVQSHEEYIERNKITNVAERGLKVVQWYEGLAEKKGSDGKSDLERLQDGISGIQTIGTIKKWALFFGITNIGAIIALILEKFLK
jgi:hypothetical protein